MEPIVSISVTMLVMFYSHELVVKHIWMLLVSKVHFDHHSVYMYSQALKLIELIRFIMYNFSSSDSLKAIYIALIWSNLEYASLHLEYPYFGIQENIQRNSATLW